MTPERLDAITGRYAALRIAVIGDFCLDRYLDIDPERAEVSIETGLPVRNVVQVRALPGGAGTVLNNLVALGVGTIHAVGFSGDDGEGFELRRALAALPGVQLGRFLTTAGAADLHLLQAHAPSPRPGAARAGAPRQQELERDPARGERRHV